MVIGLTGGIATGNSVVAKEFERLGATVICADDVSKMVVRSGSDCFSEVVEAFGNGIVQDDGELDRKKLGNIVFADKVKLKLLNSIVHPYVRKEIETKVEGLNSVSNCKGIIILDIPLLFESGDYYDYVDEVVVVYCDKKTQLERLMKRDGLNEEDALARINSQLSIDEKVKMAPVIINNMTTIEKTLIQVQDLYNNWKSKQ